MKRIVVLIFSLFQFVIAFSQSPQGFSYQAVIRDLNGQPLAEQEVSLRITLQHESGTPVHYAETHALTTSPQGVVSLAVGNGTAVAGEFNQIPWSETNINLKVEVDASGGANYAVLGITKLQAVPYALYALSGTEGPQGEAGADGVGISSIVHNADGTLTINLTDDNSYTTEDITGPKGEDGADGVDIEGITHNENGTLTITLSDETTYTTDDITGPSGTKGDEGLSAYEVWLSMGNEGTEDNFLTALKGESGEPGEKGDQGDDGRTILSGTDDPTHQGVDGDFYINTSTNMIFGPKSGESWGTGISIVGQQGEDGPVGLDGKTVLSGEGMPEEEGSDGDFFIDTQNHLIYGPKTLEDWGTGVYLIGPQGDEGVGLVYHWDNTELGVKREDESSYSYVDLKGDQGPQGLKGDKGDPGTGLQNRGEWVNGAEYTEGDFVFHRSSDDPDINSMWIAQVDEPFNSTTDPYLDSENWVEFQAPQGVGVEKTVNNGDGTFTISYTDGTSFTTSDLTGPQGPEGPLVAGTTGQTLYHDGSSWAATNQLFLNKTGVGIGTTTPEAPLDIDAIGEHIRLETTNADAWISLRESSAFGSWIGYKSNQGVWIGAGSNTGRDVRISGNAGGFGDGVVGLIVDGNNRVGIGTTSPSEILEVNGNIKAKGLIVSQKAQTADELFVVRNSNGDVVFAVYEDGVRVNVGDYTEDGSKSSRGGFAIGGLTEVGTGKSEEPELMVVTRQGTTIRFDENPTKSTRSGFALGGLTDISKDGKGEGKELMLVNREGTTIRFDESASKSTRSGFALGGLTDINKQNTHSYMSITPDNYLIGQEAGKSLTTGQFNSFMGHRAGEATSTGNRNIFIGYEAGLKNRGEVNNPSQGSSNVFIGNQAGWYNYTGHSNIFIGEESGHGNTSGINNLYLGKKSGYAGYGGSFNMFLGNESGHNINTGQNNIAMGFRAGYNLTDGIHNIFIGSQSGFYTEGTSNGHEGSHNIFIGYQSGVLNQTGSNNIFFGYQSGYKNSSGFNNVFVGEGTGYENTTGGKNVFLGLQAGYFNETGSENLYLGYGAGTQKTSGDNNTFVGTYAGINNGTGNRNVFVGYMAGALITGSDKLAIANSSTGAPLIYGEFDNNKIGINTDRPTSNLHILDANSNTAGTSGVYVDIQNNSGLWSASTSTTSGLRFKNVAQNTNNYYKAGIFFQRKSTYGRGDIIFAINNLANTSNTTPSDAAMVIRRDGNVGVGTVNPGHKLTVLSSTSSEPDGLGLGIINTTNSTFWNIHMSTSWLRISRNGSNVSYISDNGEYHVTSDKRFKDNIIAINPVMEKVMGLGVVEYTYKRNPNSNKSVGLIAQEVLELFPEFVSREDENDYYGINYSGFSVIAIKAIQEQQLIIQKQQQIINNQQKSIDELYEKNQRIESLEAEIEAIKALINM